MGQILHIRNKETLRTKSGLGILFLNYYCLGLKIFWEKPETKKTRTHTTDLEDAANTTWMVSWDLRFLTLKEVLNPSENAETDAQMAKFTQLSVTQAKLLTSRIS